MDIAVTDEKRRRAVVLGAAATSVLSLVGGIIFLLFSGQTPTQTAPLKPRSTPSTVASAPPTTDEAPSSSGDLLGAMGANFADTGSSPAAGLLNSTGGSAPIGGAPLPGLQLPPGPQAPAVNWDEVLGPAAQAQQDAIAANLTGAITGPVIGAVSSGLNSSAIVLGDLILYAAYTQNGGGLLNQLQTAIPAAALAVPAAAAAGATPAVVDFSGLNTAFAAASALPPVGMPAPPQLPAFPQLPPLPTPEQVTAALSALPALGALPALPALPPPPPGLQLPTPEQALAGAAAGAAAIAAIPALLPPPPPIGLPSLPPIGLPSLPPIGLPSIGLPSITRLLGLPF